MTVKDSSKPENPSTITRERSRRRGRAVAPGMRGERGRACANSRPGRSSQPWGSRVASGGCRVPQCTGRAQRAPVRAHAVAACSGFRCPSDRRGPHPAIGMTARSRVPPARPGQVGHRREQAGVAGHPHRRGRRPQQVAVGGVGPVRHSPVAVRGGDQAHLNRAVETQVGPVLAEAYRAGIAGGAASGRSRGRSARERRAASAVTAARRGRDAGGRAGRRRCRPTTARRARVNGGAAAPSAAAAADRSAPALRRGRARPWSARASTRSARWECSLGAQALRTRSRVQALRFLRAQTLLRIQRRSWACTAVAPTSSGAPVLPHAGSGVPMLPSTRSAARNQRAGCSNSASFCSPPRPPCEPTRPSKAFTRPVASTREISTTSPQCGRELSRSRSLAARGPYGVEGVLSLHDAVEQPVAGPWGRWPPARTRRSGPW